MLPVFGFYFHGSYRGGIVIVAAKNKKLAKKLAEKHVAFYYHNCKVGDTAHRLRSTSSKTKGIKIVDYYTE